MYENPDTGRHKILENRKTKTICAKKCACVLSKMTSTFAETRGSNVGRPSEYTRIDTGDIK